MLQAAQPDHWLPFATDRLLSEWRDLLAEQLTPGGHSQTVDVFAHRHGISPQVFLRRLDSPSAMDKAVFHHLTPAALAELETRWEAHSVELVDHYLRDALEKAPHVNLPVLGEFARHANLGRS